MKPTLRSKFALTLLWLWSAASSQAQVDVPPRPDLNARRQLAQVEVKDVANLHFTGHAFDLTPEESIEVTNPQDIQTFLVALRHANSPDGLLLDVLDVQFRPTSAQVRQPMTLRFDAQNPAKSYNEEFRHAVHTILEPCQAKRVRQIVNDHAGKVKALVLYGNLHTSEHTVITGTQDIRRLLTAMEQVDARAFVFTRPPRSRLVVYLCLVADPTGDYSDLNKAVRISFLTDTILNSKSKQKPPLPLELWKYCSSH